MRRLLTVMLCCLVPFSAFAKAITLYEEPNDTAKVVGTVELSKGIIPIYTPKDGLWIKVGDPQNGNTGWVKSNEIKDSQGNLITVQQKISEGSNGNTQSMEMTYGKPLSPEQKKAMQEQLLRQQQQSINQLQNSLEEVKQIYKQQVDNMQRLGFPVVPGMGTTPPEQNINNTKK